MCPHNNARSLQNVVGYGNIICRILVFHNNYYMVYYYNMSISNDEGRPRRAT